MRLHLTTLLLTVALLTVGASWISSVIERNALHDEMRRAKQAMREEYLASEAICRTEAMNACLSNFEPESRSRSMLVDNVIALFYWEEFLATKLETELESSTVSNLHTRLKAVSYTHLTLPTKA